MKKLNSLLTLEKVIALTLIFALTFGLLPWQDIAVAADEESFVVNTVTIFRIYDANGLLSQKRILISGSNLKDASVGIETSIGYQELKNRTVNTYGLIQFDIDNQLGKYVMVNGKVIEINEGEMPSLTGVNRKVEYGIDSLNIQGTKLTNVNDGTEVNDKIKAYLEHEGVYSSLDETKFTNDTSVIIPTLTGTLGLQNIIFEKVENLTKDFFGQSVSVKVSVKYTYLDQFRLMNKISADGIEMRPNRGEKGDTVFFEAPVNNLSDYDVFFLKEIDGTDPYSNSNKGINKTFQPNIDNKAILTVQVPNLPVGDYYVVLTNPITAGKDPMREVVKEKIIGIAQNYEKFTIIDGNIKSKIINIQPKKGPDTGSTVVVSGQFLGTLNIPEFKPSSSSAILENNLTSQELELNYGAGTYNGESGYTAKRIIKIIIGGTAEFVNKTNSDYQSFNSDLDTITLKTAQVTDADVKPVKDVVVEIVTTITNGTKIIEVKDRATLVAAFTYIPSKVVPVIDKITPGKIQVDSNNNIYPGRMLAIHGKDFMIHKYEKIDGSKVVRYPVIELGPIVIDKNQNPDIELKIFDKDGNLLDGSEGNELGTKMLVILPVDSKAVTLGKTYLKVINPMRNSESMGLSDQKTDFIEFVKPDKNYVPTISSISPNTATIDGGETISILGNNFRQGVVVYLDGEEVKQIIRQEDGKKLTFTAPKGREGETQLQVMNIEGGMDIGSFTYVKTYTNPKMTDFLPKAGEAGTYVMISGENFLAPDPTATEEFVLKLIGTRVLLEGKDINEYYIDPITKKIALQDYSSLGNESILSIGSDGKAKAADYYHGVLLEVLNSSPKKYYSISLDVKGNIMLSNGSGDNYYIEVRNGSLVANKEGGNIYNISVTESSLAIGEPSNYLLELKLKTLYKFEDGKIIGNKVKVNDRGQLFFFVPSLDANGYYDVTIINPDTKKDSRVNEKGFYYYKHPISNPLITKITPSIGSVDGGYSIEIDGQDFEDNGITKTKVFINGFEVKSENTTISTNGRKITVIVPAYQGDLWQDKGTDSISVPVVLVNTDGASVSEINGFTYVIPTSHPQITKIISQKGTAAGGDVIEITGSDFRYVNPKKVTVDEIEYLDINENYTCDSGEELTKIAFNHKQYQHYYESPLLPKIYFGSNQAKIVEFSKGYIKVISPTGSAGKVDVYLVNYDSGISNKVSFTYEASNPIITDIILDKGKKQGREKVDIHGSNFASSYIQTYERENGVIVLKEKDMTLVRFGDVDNRNISREEENSGTIHNSRATIQLAGGLKVEYLGDDGRLKLTLEEAGNYHAEIFDYDDSAVFLPLAILEKSDNPGTFYSGYEVIRIEVADRRVFVERGYSPEVEFINSNLLTVNTPSYYTVGKVTVRAINPDGGVAKGEYEYKNPSSKPKIVNITKEGSSPIEEIINGRPVKILRMSFKGGNIVSILGEDFRENVTIQISNVATIPFGDIAMNLSTKLTFEMPKVSEEAVGKLHKVVILNEDGGVASSDALAPETPIYIMFIKGETKPAIERITPVKGPFTGGTRVKIEGKDFRETISGMDKGISVYFGETRVDDNLVDVVDYKTIYVDTPVAIKPGAVKVKVENPDGELTEENIVFTYLSDPEIDSVIDAVTSDELEIISVLGGQEIKIKGSGFIEGARVLFTPLLTKVKDEIVGQDKLVYVKGEPYILNSGIEANTKYIDANTLSVTTPQGKLDTHGVIVINSDGGASSIYQDITYGLPQLKTPTGVKADLVFDSYIKIYWNEVEDAKEYEIYAVIDYNYDSSELIGTTELTSFIFQDIEPKTKYKFFIKAVGDFGSSDPSYYTSTLWTDSSHTGVKDADGGLNDYTKLKRIGDTANITLGSKDYYYKGNMIDLTKGDFAGSKELVMSIPAYIASQNSYWDITIITNDGRISFNPYAFNTAKIRDNRNKTDAGVRFKLSVIEGSNGLGGVNTSQTTLSNQYILSAEVYIGNEKTKLDNLSAPMYLTIYYDTVKANMRKLTNISLSKYDPYLVRWSETAKKSSEVEIIFGKIERLGTYQVIGGRR